ncbi:MAG: ribonuclease HII [Anaerolineales bacterium]|nr:ribonuclease HII [Anaerolineales bacterium]MBS3753209.1 ribonuclease HII [Anaerolineales bacterium]
MRSRLDPCLIPPKPNLDFESAFWKAHIPYIAGIDEAGRGALAGPVAVGAVILPPNPDIEKALSEVRDSKELTPSERESLKGRIQAEALGWNVAFATSGEIDMWGIIPAIRLAAQRAIDNIHPFPKHLLLDYLQLPDNPIPQTWLVKGDARSLSIAAASILAKTIRDKHLVELEKQYPSYQFFQNKGYGTKAHRRAIAEKGPTPIHRMSFAPMRHMREG